MGVWISSTVLAAAITAAGLGLAAVSAGQPSDAVAPRGDRLVASASSTGPRYITVETRGAGSSILTRIEVAHGS